MKLNLGCGSNKIRGCVNVDISTEVKPDIVADFTQNLPFEDNSADAIYLFHVIEHIQESKHRIVLAEAYRVLKTGCPIFISYPEFRRVAENYITNYKGKRDFWKNTIYGRQSRKDDYHVSLMDTDFFLPTLKLYGFQATAKPELNDPWNTVVRAVKGKPVMTQESLYRREFFGLTQ